MSYAVSIRSKALWLELNELYKIGSFALFSAMFGSCIWCCCCKKSNSDNDDERKQERRHRDAWKVSVHREKGKAGESMTTHQVASYYN